MIIKHENLTNLKMHSWNSGKNNYIFYKEQHQGTMIWKQNATLHSTFKKVCLYLQNLDCYLQNLCMVVCDCVWSGAAFKAHRWQQCCTMFQKRGGIPLAAEAFWQRACFSLETKSSMQESCFFLFWWLSFDILDSLEEETADLSSLSLTVLC